MAFGELVRSSIDLYRFDLLDALRLAGSYAVVQLEVKLSITQLQGAT